MLWMPGYLTDEQKSAGLEKCFTEGVPKFLQDLERKLPEAGWICGDKLTWIDFLVGGIIYNNFLNAASKRATHWAPAWETAGAKTKAYAERFGEEFKEYLASRPAAPI